MQQATGARSQMPQLHGWKCVIGLERLRRRGGAEQAGGRRRAETAGHEGSGLARQGRVVMIMAYKDV